MQFLLPLSGRVGTPSDVHENNAPSSGSKMSNSPQVRQQQQGSVVTNSVSKKIFFFLFLARITRYPFLTIAPTI